jgi:hypothetical protein
MLTENGAHKPAPPVFFHPRLHLLINKYLFSRRWKALANPTHRRQRAKGSVYIVWLLSAGAATLGQKQPTRASRAAVAMR